MKRPDGSAHNAQHRGKIKGRGNEHMRFEAQTGSFDSQRTQLGDVSIGISLCGAGFP